MKVAALPSVHDETVTQVISSLNELMNEHKSNASLHSRLGAAIDLLKGSAAASATAEAEEANIKR